MKRRSPLADRLAESAHLAEQLARLLPQVAEEGYRPTFEQHEAGPVSGTKNHLRPPPSGSFRAGRAFRESVSRLARADLSLSRALAGRYRASPLSPTFAGHRQAPSSREALALAVRTSCGLRIGRERAPHLGPVLRGHLAGAADDVARAHRLARPYALQPRPAAVCVRRKCSALAELRSANGRCAAHRWCVECGDREASNDRGRLCRRCAQRRTRERKGVAHD